MDPTRCSSSAYFFINLLQFVIRPNMAMMFRRALLVVLILSLFTVAQAGSKKTVPSDDKGQVARTCGALQDSASLRFVDDFSNHWLDEDAKYVITDPERAAYKMLHNDEERDH